MLWFFLCEKGFEKYSITDENLWNEKIEWGSVGQTFSIVIQNFKSFDSANQIYIFKKLLYYLAFGNLVGAVSAFCSLRKICFIFPFCTTKFSFGYFYATWLCTDTADLSNSSFFYQNFSMVYQNVIDAH